MEGSYIQLQQTGQDFSFIRKAVEYFYTLSASRRCMHFYSEIKSSENEILKDIGLKRLKLLEIMDVN